MNERTPKYEDAAPDGYKLEWDPNGMQVAWLDRINAETGELLNGDGGPAEFKNGKWVAAQTAVVLSTNRENLVKVLSWLNEYYPTGRPTEK